MKSDRIPKYSKRGPRPPGSVPANFDKFNLLPKLPWEVELCLIIWRLARFTPRYFDLRSVPMGKSSQTEASLNNLLGEGIWEFESDMPTPGFLTASCEARHATRPHFQNEFGRYASTFSEALHVTIDLPARILINWVCDMPIPHPVLYRTKLLLGLRYAFHATSY